MFELQCPEWLWPLSSPCLDALNSHWHCDDHPRFKVWENIASFWVFLSALKFYFEFECHGSQSTVNPTCSRKLRYGTPHHPMMFGKDLGKQHVWRKVYDIHGLCSLGCLQIWTLPVFSQKGLLGSSWSSSCLMPLVRSDVPGQKSGCGSLLQDFSSIERFRGKIMYPNFFGSSWSNYLCIFLSFFSIFGSRVSPGLPRTWEERRGDPGPPSSSHVGIFAAGWGAPKSTLRLYTKSFI